MGVLEYPNRKGLYMGANGITEVAERAIFDVEIPGFAAKVLSAVKTGFPQNLSKREAVRLEAFYSCYELWRDIEVLKGREGTFGGFLRYCREGLDVGYAKYGCGWPNADCLGEALEELRDAANYVMLDHMDSQLQDGVFDRILERY